VEAQTNPTMTFVISEPDPDTAVVAIAGELDISNVSQLEAGVAPFIQRRVGRLVLDLTELAFADSSAIAIWVRWSTLVGELRLRGASPLLRTVITTMGLTGTLRLER
jgi:anti-anti-sigma factor